LHILRRRTLSSWMNVSERVLSIKPGQA
jgi:hypothetical protein